MDWPVFRLDELFDIARGGSPRPIKSYLTNDDDGVNWIKISDASASGKYITETKEKIRPEGISKSRLVRKGDFLLSNSMSFGRPYIMGTDGCIHDGWLVLSPKSDRMDQDFLFYLLGSPTVFSQFDRLAAGSTVRNLNISLVSGVKVPLPSLEEQKRIVAMLDEAFADIEKTQELTEQNLKNARELFESYLSELFCNVGSDWVETHLSKYVKFIDYRGRTPLKTDSGLRLITAKNVRMGYVKNQPEEFVASDSYDSWMTRGIPKKGDVLFTTEAPLANVAQLDTDEKVVFAQRVIIMQPDRSVLHDSFLKYLLMSKPIQTSIHERGTGATATGIKASLLKKILIKFPGSLKKQEEIAERLNKLSQYTAGLTDLYTLKLIELDNLRNSVLQKAFGN